MIDIPDTMSLRQLWQLAFADEESFIDLFFENGFSPERCSCIHIDGRLAAALYWFDFQCCGQKIAYVYGVATHPDFRGRGLCRKLMTQVHTQLEKLGYIGVLLVPQNDSLREMYRKIGYQDCTTVTEFFCTDDPYPAPMHAIDCEEYTRLRLEYLPERSVIPEDNSLAFLNACSKFYKGMDFVMAATSEGDSLFAMEYLGNRESAPGILCSLGFSQGTFRTIGDKIPFAMFHPLKNKAVTPYYFAFAFD